MIYEKSLTGEKWILKIGSCFKNVWVVCERINLRTRYARCHTVRYNLNISLFESCQLKKHRPRATLNKHCMPMHPGHDI